MIETILSWLVTAFIFCVQAIVYVTYFFPILGARILDWLGLWPHLWPFTGFF